MLSLHLKKSPPPGFTDWLRREIPFGSLVRDSEALRSFLCILMLHTSCFLLDRGDFLRFLYLLLILQSHPMCCQSPVYFSLGSAECSILCTFSQFCSQAGFLHMLSSFLQSLTSTTVRGSTELAIGYGQSVQNTGSSHGLLVGSIG